MEAKTWEIVSHGEELGFYSRGTGKLLRDLNKGMSVHILFQDNFSVCNWFEWMRAAKE